VRRIKTLKVGPETLTVKYIKNLKTDGATEDYGSIDVQEGIVRFDAALKGRQHDMTVFHEWLHGLIQVSGLVSLMDDKTEEALVLMLEHHVFPMLDLNKFYQLTTKK
jgi:hypothetical protein